MIISGGFALLLVAMLLLGAGMAAWSTHRTLETLRLVDHTRQVRLQLEQMLVSVVDAEGALGGYLLTRDEAFHERIDLSLANAARAYGALNELIQDDPEQQRRLQHFSIRLEERTASIKEQSSPEAALTFTAERVKDAVRRGKEKLDEIRGLIAEMEAVEDQLLAERAEAARKASSYARITITVGTVVALAIVAISAWIVWRDTKTRKHAARQLLQARKFAESIVDTVHDALLVLDPNFRIARANRSFYETFKLPPHKVLGHPLANLGDGVWMDDELLRQMQAILRDNGDFQKLELEKEFPGLGRKTMSVSGRRLPAQADGAAAEILLSAEDITERKQAERHVIELNGELSRRAALLEAANVELEAFSYSVSHDLRAPLRHIDGFAEMLRKHAGATLDEKGQRFLNTISESAKRMGTLIDDLLLFSRMGRGEMHFASVDLDQLVEEAVREVQPPGESRNIEWQRSPLPTVEGDRALLRQVFVNLLSNAMKYSRTKDPAIIQIGTVPGEPHEVIVFVKDNGVGFDMAYGKKLFGVFQRLHGTHEFEGTGIGLANVRRIVSRHGGRTWAEGQVGEGATFYFSIPALGATASSEPG